LCAGEGKFGSIVKGRVRGRGAFEAVIVARKTINFIPITSKQPTDHAEFLVLHTSALSLRPSLRALLPKSPPSSLAGFCWTNRLAVPPLPNRRK